MPASELALHYLKRPTPNTILLGAFAAMSDLLELDGVEKAIREKFAGKIGEMNVAAAKAGYSAAQSAAGREAQASC